MNKAVYAPQREEHYALDMEHYCHFTSPIRRYPDLTVHRLVQKLLDGKTTPDDPFPMLVKLGHHCSDMERNAAAAERELIELKLLHFLKKHLGETMEAVISRVFADGHSRTMHQVACRRIRSRHNASQRQVSLRTSRTDVDRIQRRQSISTGRPVDGQGG